MGALRSGSDCVCLIRGGSLESYSVEVGEPVEKVHQRSILYTGRGACHYHPCDRQVYRSKTLETLEVACKAQPKSTMCTMCSRGAMVPDPKPQSSVENS
jgi:hypothetical protein